MEAVIDRTPPPPAGDTWSSIDTVCVSVLSLNVFAHTIPAVKTLGLTSAFIRRAVWLQCSWCRNSVLEKSHTKTDVDGRDLKEDKK